MRTSIAELTATPTRSVHFRPPAPRLALRETEAAEAFGISPGTFRNLVAEGKMPKPTYISPRIPLYDLNKLQAAWQDLQEAGGIAQNNPWDE